LSYLPNKYGETIEVKRLASGSYVDGSWVAGDETVSTILATVMPMTPKEMALLPEGFQENQGIVIYSEKELRQGSEATKADGDIISWVGNQYQVLKVELRNQIPRLRHYKSIAVKYDGIK
jgi:hypothetical protein